MHQNVLHLGDTAGTLLLICYVIVGLATAAAGLLPGNASRFRLLCLILGLALAVWSTKVFFTGGPMIVGLGVLLVPLSLTATAIAGTYRTYSRRHALARLSRPHPAAARTYAEPTSPFTMSAAPVPAHIPWPSTRPTSAQLLPGDAALLPAAAPHSALTPAHCAPAALTPAHSAPAPAPTRLAPVSTQPRFHGHAIAPPAAFLTPPRFAPQPLHNVPSPRPALDNHITAQAPTGSRHSSPSQPSHSPQEWARAQVWPGTHDQFNAVARTNAPDLTGAPDPAPLRDPSRLRDSGGRSRGVVPPQPTETTTSWPVSMPAVRMPLAPVTDPSPLQPSTVRARHRAAGTSA